MRTFGAEERCMYPKLRSKDEAFSSERNRQIDGECGRIENVKRPVQKALDSGILGGEQD